jgi:hypothetical protein
MAFSLERKSSNVHGETFEHNGELVIVLSLLSDVLTDEDELAIVNALREFVSFQKRTPTRYHMIINSHRVLVFPLDRIINVYRYIERKEKYLRRVVGTTSYVIQGRVTEMALNTLNSMFETWSTTRTFSCIPCSGEYEHSIPRGTFDDVMAFIDSEEPRKGL